MSVSVLLLGPPAAAAVASFVVPSIFFPRIPKCAPESPELLQHCQRLAQRFIGVSVMATALVWIVGCFFYQIRGPDSATDRVVFVARLETAAVLFYAFTILRVAVQRGADAKGVLGERTGIASATEIAIRVLNNTTEQLLLGVLTHLTLALILPSRCFGVLVGVVSLWLTGRVLFVIGYSAEHPMGRELGFDLTFLPSVLSAVYAVIYGLLLW
jgi:uncharacterized membrane protein YecN with MAPEG domain